jgi:hypothetical protein
LKAYEQYKEDEILDEEMVKRRKSARIIVGDSIDKTEFGNSKI